MSSKVEMVADITHDDAYGSPRAGDTFSVTEDVAADIEQKRPHLAHRKGGAPAISVADTAVEQLGPVLAAMSDADALKKLLAAETRKGAKTAIEARIAELAKG